ncbi:poly-gamma-glutamate system protein [bacterium]|nr:poly-gamma-glutamate system protein [bacterium]
MFWRPSRVSNSVLLMLAFIGIIVTVAIEVSKKVEKQAYFDEKLRAANIANEAQRIIREYRDGRHIVIDPITDPNSTGLIGEEFTLITTDRGNLESKLTSTNPNFAAIVVDMLKEVRVKEGDWVLVGWTGSLPGINIAVLSALKALGLNAVIITSVGASQWGANNPDLTWLDMETIMVENGIFNYKSVAASMGGRGDRGGNISIKGRELIEGIIDSNKVVFINDNTLHGSIEKRMKIYAESLNKNNPKVFINVGGGLGNVGSSQNLVMLEPGIIKFLKPKNYPQRGAMIRFGLQGIPIINLTDINRIANDYGLPIAPEPIPVVPHGEVFFNEKYNFILAIILLIAYAFLVFVLIRVDLKSLLFRKK